MWLDRVSAAVTAGTAIPAGWAETRIGVPTQERSRPEKASSLHDACTCVRSRAGLSEAGLLGESVLPESQWIGIKPTVALAS